MRNADPEDEVDDVEAPVNRAPDTGVAETVDDLVAPREQGPGHDHATNRDGCEIGPARTAHPPDQVIADTSVA